MLITRAVSKMINFKQPPLIFAIALLLFALPCEAYITEYNEVKGELASKQTVYIVEPRLFKGDPTWKAEALQPETSFSVPAAGIRESAMGMFEKSGYRALGASHLGEEVVSSEAYRKASSVAWESVLKFSEAGQHVKKKMLPYSIVSAQQELASIAGADALIFSQCFGDFQYESGRTAAAVSTVGGAISGALTGVVSFVPGGTQIIFKISAIDAKTGSLIWYREGIERNVVVTDKGMLMNTFDDIFKYEIPKAAKPFTGTKFKKKRSEIAAQQA